MKKLMMLLVAAALMFSLSGQAAAYFEEGSLIQVIYERGGTKEIVTDLGNRITFDPARGLVSPYGGPIVTKPMSNILTDLGAASWDNVYVAYFMRYNQGGDNFVWISGAPGGQIGRGSAGNNLISKIGNVAGMNHQTGQARNVNLQSDPNSFSSLFGTMGNYFGFLTTPTGEANLAALGTGGSVTQYLYYYNAPTNRSLTYNGLPVMVAKTFANKAELSPVPIPATVYLLGAGLIGLIGIRRRMGKNS